MTPTDAAPTNSARRTGTIAALGALPVMIIGAVFLMGVGGDPDTISTEGAVADAATTVAPITSPVFGEPTATKTPPSTFTTTAPTTVAPTTPTPTTPLAPTIVAPTTALAPTTVPAETLPEQPIAPPPDPRGDEEQVQLGGIAIPKLGVDAPLLEGIRLTTLDNGPGHWPGTAMPGEVGNVVVAAHRTSHGAPFRDIDQLVAGDVVEFTTSAGVIEYMVTGTQIVEPDAIWIVDPTDTPTATLFACHPPGSTRQRIVVNLELS
jgi:sortase A